MDLSLIEAVMLPLQSQLSGEFVNVKSSGRGNRY
jgi:hypothetical protein